MSQTTLSNRRDFMTQAVAASGMLSLLGSRLAAAEASRSRVNAMRVLVIGGTGQVGSHCVRTALERGHRVTILSRGKRQSTSSLPAEVEVLSGDRNNAADLDALKNRDWDAIIDTAAFAPKGVRMLGEVVKGRVGQYIFISTVMTYARNAGKVDESSAVLPYTASADPYSLKMPSGWVEYGALKVLCERDAQQQFPKTLVVRPGVISGPEDDGDHLAFWLWRMHRGGEILAPGDPLAPVQYIDGRDLAEWIVQMMEQGETGLYNTVGPAQPMGMGELLGAARSLFSIPMHLTWVPTQWLTEQGLKADDVPFFWLKDPQTAQRDELWLSYRVSSEKAIAKGLRFRSVADTLSANWAWYQTLPPQRQAAPRPSLWSSHREQQLLSAWHARRRAAG